MPKNLDLISDRMQELLYDLTTRKPIEQALIALESGDYSIRWIGAKGETDTDTNQVCEETPFFIASIDKLYNATILMMLNETGQLNLDDPISTYLPSIVTRGLHQLNGVDYTDRITVRHLLSHTSGLADWLEDFPKSGISLINRVIDEGDMTITINDLVNFVRDQLKPHFPPQDLTINRSKVRYSDTNYMFIIAIIEAVTGQPLHKVHEQMLYLPLDLRHTYFPGLSKPLDPTPAPMILRIKGCPLHIPLLMSSIRGIYSTVADTITFLRRFIRNEIFQNPVTFASMQAHWNRFGLPFDRAALRSPGWPIEYGLGIMRFRLPRIFTSMQTIPPVIGHTGSTGCWLFWCTEWDIFLSGSVDEITAGSLPYRVVPKILKIFKSLN